MFGYQPPRLQLPPPPPTPGQVVGAIGQGMQAVESLVTQGVNSVVDAVQQVVTQATAPNSQPVIGGSNGQSAEVVSAATFRDVITKLADAITHLRAEIASVRAEVRAGGAGGGGGFNFGGGFGGGGGLNDLLMLKVLGIIDFGSGSSGTLDTTTLLLLMMSGGGAGAANSLLPILLLNGSL